MSELARPAAKRLERPSWRDSRLVVGILLVIVAATLGARAVASADDRVPVWVAGTDLVAGEQVAASSFVRADVRLADGMNGYLGADAPAPVGSYLLRDVRAGELVPLSAVGSADDVDVQRVTVRADSASATGLARGSRVDVYVTPRTATGGSDGPGPRTSRLVRAAAVTAVLAGQTGFGTDATTSVQILVPSDTVPSLVAAVDGDARLTLVPVVGSASGAGA
jgi:hypothetical protein